MLGRLLPLFTSTLCNSLSYKGVVCWSFQILQSDDHDSCDQRLSSRLVSSVLGSRDGRLRGLRCLHGLRLCGQGSTGPTGWRGQYGWPASVLHCGQVWQPPVSPLSGRRDSVLCGLLRMKVTTVPFSLVFFNIY